MFPKSSVTELRRCCRQAIHREIDDYLLAAIFGQLDAAKILIQAGADLNSQNNMGGTALQKTGCADASLPVNRTIAVLVQEHAQSRRTMWRRALQVKASAHIRTIW